MLREKRERIFKRDGGVCWLCGMPIEHRHEFTLDHVIPKSKGGDNSYENLKVAHAYCNSVRGSKDTNECDPKLFIRRPKIQLSVFNLSEYMGYSVLWRSLSLLNVKRISPELYFCFPPDAPTLCASLVYGSKALSKVPAPSPIPAKESAGPALVLTEITWEVIGLLLGSFGVVFD